MRLLSGILWTVATAVLLADCSGIDGSPSSSVLNNLSAHNQAHHSGVALSAVPKSFIKFDQGFHYIKAPISATRGIVTAEFQLMSGNVLVYPKGNKANGPPNCNISTYTNINDVAVDSLGDLVIPDGLNGVLVYAPPFSSSSCGQFLGNIPITYGQASDAAANNALNQAIVVGNIDSDLVVNCTLASLKCTVLTTPNIATFAGVAMDKNGNCYADGFNTSNTVSLWYYPGCTGTATQLGPSNGFYEPYSGGLDIDKRGHLIVISQFNSTLSTPSTITVYSGCNTGACTVVGGPFAGNGEYVFGHLNRRNDRFVAGNVFNGIDIFSYKGHGTGLSYLYSFNNGLECATNECEAAAYMPR